jgi:hypothetical protein
MGKRKAHVQALFDQGTSASTKLPSSLKHSALPPIHSSRKASTKPEILAAPTAVMFPSIYHKDAGEAARSKAIDVASRSRIKDDPDDEMDVLVSKMSAHAVDERIVLPPLPRPRTARQPPPSLPVREI